jgi:anti-sigma B factor antagonist
MAEGVDVIHDDGARAVVVVRGEIDVASCPALNGIVADLTCPEIVLDLAEVTFMDSSGLAALLRAERRARELGGRLLLRAPSRAVLDVLQMTHLDDRFTVEGEPGS